MSASDDLNATSANNISDDSENEDEGDDMFTTEPTLLLDRDSLARIGRERRRGPPSVASTDLASTIGSVVGRPQDACRKSITFYNDNSLEWDITFGVAEFRKRGLFKKGKAVNRLFVESLRGCFEHSTLHEGDFLTSINDKPSPLDPDLALKVMRESLRNDGYLSLSVENPEGSDTLMQATVIKPRPDMTYEEMGMIVWYWGYLCIRAISENSIFHLTVLKEGDHIVSINDIKTEDMKVEQFAQCISTLDHEITFTVLRRKRRLSGNFC